MNTNTIPNIVEPQMDNLVQSIQEINRKIIKDFEEIQTLHEQLAYAAARMQGKIHDRNELIKNFNNVLFK